MLHTGTKFTQVRTSSGGGTRIVEMADASTYAEIKNRAIEIFFPNGKKKRLISNVKNIVILVWKILTKKKFSCNLYSYRKKKYYMYNNSKVASSIFRIDYFKEIFESARYQCMCATYILQKIGEFWVYN